MKQSELELRVLYALMIPIGRLAVRLGIDLKALRRVAEIAYYREARRQRFKMREIQDLMSVSLSKAAGLSRELKQHFALPESEHGLPRRLMSLLWAEPLTEKRIVRALDDFSAEEVEAALAKLVEEQRVEVVDGRTTRYRLSDTRYRFVEDRWMARFEALNSFMVAAYHAIVARFFDGDERAFVRTLRFRVADVDWDELKTFYEEQLFPLIARLDARASDEAGATPVRLAVNWAPDPDADEDETKARAGDSTDDEDGGTQ